VLRTEWLCSAIRVVFVRAFVMQFVLSTLPISRRDSTIDEIYLAVLYGVVIGITVTVLI